MHHDTSRSLSELYGCVGRASTGFHPQSPPLAGTKPGIEANTVRMKRLDINRLRSELDSDPSLQKMSTESHRSPRTSDTPTDAIPPAHTLLVSFWSVHNVWRPALVPPAENIGLNLPNKLTGPSIYANAPYIPEHFIRHVATVD